VLDLVGVIEVDKNQVGLDVVATRVDDGSGADAVAKGSGKPGALVDVSVA
jgi:hypothetical protein